MAGETDQLLHLVSRIEEAIKDGNLIFARALTRELLEDLSTTTNSIKETK
ncbi:MAG: hypothetical protein JWM44_2082 [Bacilli bacterium]|nr:hypothetical protein [Bacilli bacterium]